MPSLEMERVDGNGETYVGATVVVQITLQVPHDAFYQMLDVELRVPYANDSAVASICRAEIAYVGKNMPCFNKERANGNITNLRG